MAASALPCVTGIVGLPLVVSARTPSSSSRPYDSTFEDRWQATRAIRAVQLPYAAVLF